MALRELLKCCKFLGLGLTLTQNETVIVKIYEAPDEMVDTLLTGSLSHYGKVLSFQRDLSSLTILNGIRMARLDKHIPSSCFIAGEMLFFFIISLNPKCAADVGKKATRPDPVLT